MKKLIGGGLVALAIGLALAAPANAMHYRGYLDALDAAGMIDHTNSYSCHVWTDGCKWFQFNADGEEAILAGNYACDQLDAGRSPAEVADAFLYSEGLRYDGTVIVAAAQQHICNSPGQR